MEHNGYYSLALGESRYIHTNNCSFATQQCASLLMTCVDNMWWWWWGCFFFTADLRDTLSLVHILILVYIHYIIIVVFCFRQ